MRLWSASVHSWVTFWPVFRVITHGQLIALSIYVENITADGADTLADSARKKLSSPPGP